MEFQKCPGSFCHNRPCDNGKHITQPNQCRSPIESFYCHLKYLLKHSVSQTTSGDCSWGGRGHTADGKKKTIGTACECDQIPARCCDGDGGRSIHKDYEYVDPTNPFCQKLPRPASDRSAWTRPFTGFDAQNKWVERWLLDIYCNKIPTAGNRLGGVPAGPKTYRKMTTISGVEHGVSIPMEERFASERQENSRPSPIRPNVPGGGNWSD